MVTRDSNLMEGLTGVLCCMLMACRVLGKLLGSSGLSRGFSVETHSTANGRWHQMAI
jgi:hypothetical protein